MSNEPIALQLPLVEMAVDGDLDADRLTIALSTGAQAVAAVLTAAQTQQLVEAILAASALSVPDRPQTTHTGPLNAAPVELQQIGVAQGSRDGTIVLAFPIGRLTVAFQLPTGTVVNTVGRFLQSGVQGPAAPKPN